MPKNEFEVVKHFSTILNLPNQTDGTLFIYLKPNSLEKTALKPDGYYHYEGVTFILDAKGEGKKFNNQLEDYMRLESNPNYIGFKYSGDKFFCYIKGKINEYETQPQRAEYYIKKFFNIKTTNEDIVNNSAKKLAQLFREAGIDKQMNVPFIGALMLCLKFKKEILNNTTRGILNFAREGITDIISETPLSRKQKKEFLKRILDDSTLQKCKIENLLLIISEISKIYNFINVSEKKGHDTMNNFLKIFRKWNSANSKEKGEVFTPDHIAQLMYKLIDCNKSDTILDPTCGSGTFLTNAMANMLSETEDADEQKDIKENRLIGIELNEFNCTLAGINMMLHGDGASQIFYEDCFKKLPLLKDCYNKVLMNPPFSQPSIPELKFVSIALNNMRGGGCLHQFCPFHVYYQKSKIILEKMKF